MWSRAPGFRVYDENKTFGPPVNVLWTSLVSAGAQAQQSVPSWTEGIWWAGRHRPPHLHGAQSRRGHEPHRHGERNAEPEGQKVTAWPPAASHTIKQLRRVVFSTLVICMFQGRRQDSTRVGLHPRALPSKSGCPAASRPLPTVRLTTERRTAMRTRSRWRIAGRAAHLLTHAHQRAMATRTGRRPPKWAGTSQPTSCSLCNLL